MNNNDKTIMQLSYYNQGGAKKRLEQMGNTYDSLLSTNESKVFVDKHGNPNIAFRGSKRASDFASDALLGVGLSNIDRRHIQAQELTKKVEDKYGKPANVYGDSLGGHLAEYSKASGKITTHNKAVGILDIGKTIPKKQLDYRNSRDIVSLPSLTQKHKYNNIKQRNTKKGWFNILGNHTIL